jgi:hypothetical protein
MDPKRQRWQNLWHRLQSVHFHPLPSDAEVEAARSVLASRLRSVRLENSPSPTIDETASLPETAAPDIPPEAP